MEMRGSKNSQKNHEKEEQSWRTHIFWFQNLLQNYSQDWMVLA